jgi:hypothetical protein
MRSGPNLLFEDFRKDAKDSAKMLKKGVMNENELFKIVVDICFKIHTPYGPGLFESVYQGIFDFEWKKTNVPYVN